MTDNSDLQVSYNVKELISDLKSALNIGFASLDAKLEGKADKADMAKLNTELSYKADKADVAALALTVERLEKARVEDVTLAKGQAKEEARHQNNEKNILSTKRWRIGTALSVAYLLGGLLTDLAYHAILGH